MVYPIMGSERGLKTPEHILPAKSTSHRPLIIQFFSPLESYSVGPIHIPGSQLLKIAGESETPTKTPTKTPKVYRGDPTSSIIVAQKAFSAN